MFCLYFKETVQVITTSLFHPSHTCGCGRDEITKRSYAALLFDEMICVAKIVPVL